MQLFVTLGNLDLKLYVFFWRFLTFWNSAVMSHFTSKHSLRSVSILYHLVTFVLKWWDGWAPQTICWGIFVLLAPVKFPPYCIDLSLALESFDPAVWDTYPKALLKKDSLSCSSCHSISWFLLRDIAFTFTAGYLHFMILLFGNLDFIDPCAMLFVCTVC